MWIGEKGWGRWVERHWVGRRGGRKVSGAISAVGRVLKRERGKDAKREYGYDTIYSGNQGTNPGGNQGKHLSPPLSILVSDSVSVPLNSTRVGCSQHLQDELEDSVPTKRPAPPAIIIIINLLIVIAIFRFILPRCHLLQYCCCNTSWICYSISIVIIIIRWSTSSATYLSELGQGREECSARRDRRINQYL